MSESYSVKAILSAVDQGFGSVFKGAQSTVGGLERSLKGGLGFGVMAGVGQAAFNAVAGSVKSLASDVLTVGKNFDSSMSQVQATKGISDASASFEQLNTAALSSNETFQKVAGSLDIAQDGTVNTMDALGALASQLGADTKFTATEAADAINNLSMAGMDTQAVFENLPTVLDMATAGGIDLDYSAQLVANGLAIMGDKCSGAEEMADKLAVTASSAYGSVADFGEGLLVAGGQANICGLSLTDTYTALGILGNNGMQASEGGTMLRNTLKNLYQPTDKAAEALKDLGVQTADSEGNLRPMQDVLKDLGSAMDELNPDERSRMMSEIFDTRTIAGADALIRNCGDAWDELVGKIDNADGAAKKMAKTQLDNLAGDVTIMGSAMDTLKKSIFDNFNTPMRIATKLATAGISAVTDTITNMGSLFESFDLGAIQDAIDEGGFAAGMAELTDQVSEQFDNMVSVAIEKGPEMISELMNGIASGIPGAIASMAGFLGDILDVMTANLPAMINGGAAIIRNIMNGISQAAPQLIGKGALLIKTYLEGLKQNMPLVLSRGVAMIESIVSGLTATLPDIVPLAIDTVSTFAKAIMEQLPTIVSLGESLISSIVIGASKRFPWITELWESLKTSISTVGSAFGSAIKAIMKSLGGLKGSAAPLSGIKNILGVVTKALETFAKFCEKNSDIIAKLIGKLPYLLAAFVGLKVVGKVGGIFGSFGKVLGGVRNLLGGGITPAISGVSGAFGAISPVHILAIGAAIGIVIAAFALLATQGDGVATILHALGDVLVQVIGAFGEVLAKALPQITEFVSVALPLITTFVTEVIAAATQLVSTLVSVVSEAVIGIVGAISDGISQILTALSPIVDKVAEVMIAVANAFVELSANLPAIIDSIAGVVDSLGEAIRNSLEGVASIIDSVFEGIKGTLEGFAAVIESAGEAMAAAFVGAGIGIQSALEGVSEVVSSVFEGIQGTLDGVAGIVESAGSAAATAFEGMGTGISTALGGISTVVDAFSAGIETTLGAVGGFFESMGTAIETACGGISKIIDSLSSGITSVLEGIGGIFESMGEGAKSAGEGTDVTASAIERLVALPLADLAATLATVTSAVKKLSKSGKGSEKTGGGLEKVATSMEKITTSLSGFTDVVDTVTTSLDTIKESTSALKEEFSSISESTGTLQSNLMIIDQAFSNLTSKSAEMVSAMEQISSAMETLGESTSSAPDAVAGIADSISGLDDAMSGMDFSEAFDSLATSAESAVNGMTEQLQGAVTSAGTIASEIGTALNGGLSGATTAGTTIGNGFTTALLKAGAKAVVYAKQIITKTNAAFMAGKGNASKAGTTLGTSFTTGINSKASAANSAGSTLKARAISGMTGSAYSQGSSIGSSFTSGVSAHSGSASSAGSSLKSGAISGMSSGSGSASSLGSTFGSSYAAGVRAKWQEAYNAGYSLGKAAAAGTQAAQVSGSPSKVAISLGKDYTNGYAIGINSNASKAVAAAKNTVKKTVKATSPAGKLKKALLTGMNDLTKYGKKYLQGSYSKLKSAATKGNFKSVSSSIAKSFKTAFNSKASSLKTSVKNQIKNITDTLKKSSKDSSFTKAGTAITNAFTKQFDTMKDKAITAATDALNKLGEKYQKKYDAIVNKQKAFYERLSKVDSFYSADDYGNVKLADFSAATQQLSQFQSNLKKLKGALPNSLMEEIVGMDTQAGLEYTNALLKMSSSDLKKYGQSYTKYLNKASSVSKDYYSAEIKAVKDAYTKEAKTVYNDLQKKMTDIGKNAVISLSKAMTSQSKTISDAGKKLMQNMIGEMEKSIVTAYKSTALTMAKSGKYTADGLYKAIVKNLGLTSDAGKALAKSVSTSYAKQLKIKSPSRVMYALGENTVEGAVNAIKAGESEMWEAAGKLVRIPSMAAAKAPDMDLKAARDYSLDEEFTYHHESTVYVPFYINGRKFAEATSDDMTDVQNRKSRQSLRKQGIA